MRGTPRELLTELIGEELTAQYFEGLPIEIEAENCKYTIERKRGYADIVRTRKVRVSDSFFSDNYGISVVGNYFDTPPNPEPRPQPQQPEERFHIQTDSGRLKAWNIDDAVASFIQAAKIGKVNWGCGNIDVRLPSSMPPKDLGITTFVRRGLSTMLYGIVTSVESLKNKTISLISGDTSDFSLIFLVWWIINALIGLVVWLPLDQGVPFPQFWATYLGWVMIKLIPLYLFVISIKYYASWKTQWEVKMK